MNAVQSLVKERSGYEVPVSSHERSAELLGPPLTEEAAVEVALLNNASLRADLAELGIAEADLVLAGRLDNPRFTFSRLVRGDVVDIERKFTLNLMSLLTRPLVTRIESRRFEQAQLKAASDVLQLIAETRTAYYSAVAANETLRYAEQVKSAAEASAELGRRMAQTGNWSELNHMREQAFYADAVSLLARAQHTAVAERERLVRLLGISEQDTPLTLMERLPELPGSPLELRDAEGVALERRLDVLMARKEIEGLAASLTLSKGTRFANVLDASYLRNSTTGEPRQSGYEIELQLPLFDWGGARIARSELLYQQAVNRTAAIALNAQSEVRETYHAYRTAYDLARHLRDEVVPLQKRISDEMLLRYNGMFISVFELLADAREQVRAVAASVEATRDFWVAQAELEQALSGRSKTKDTKDGAGLSRWSASAK